MKQILLATNNKHKVIEIKDIIGADKFDILTPGDLDIDIEIEEDTDSLEGNAMKKAMAYYEIAKIPALADDTGLFVTALKGEPGVYSSRYAGINATYNDNCEKLLSNMKDVAEDNRLAFFRTVVCYYISENHYYFFEGICKGKISNNYSGKNGFGYDPLFIPDGYGITYAEMTESEKNRISHRGKAFISFSEFVEKNNTH